MALLPVSPAINASNAANAPATDSRGQTRFGNTDIGAFEYLFKVINTSDNPSLGSLDQPPFYGLELRPSLGTTSAGLLADANGQVLHQRRHPIPGLYASGVVAVRNELGAGYQAGLNLASAMTFSLLAVRHMRGQ